MMTDLLLVEDNQDCRTTVAAILRLQGFEVTEAEDDWLARLEDCWGLLFATSIH